MGQCQEGWDSQGSVVKNLPANTGDPGALGSTPGSWRSPGGGNGNPFQYSCLGNLIDRGAWHATSMGVAKGSDLIEWLEHACTLERILWLRIKVLSSDKLLISNKADIFDLHLSDTLVYPHKAEESILFCFSATHSCLTLYDSMDCSMPDSPGEGNGKPLQHSCLENPMNSRKKYFIWGPPKPQPYFLKLNQN